MTSLVSPTAEELTEPQYMTTIKHVGPGFPQMPVAVIGMNAEKRKPGERSHVAIDQANQAKQQLSGFVYFDIDDSAPSLWSAVYEIARYVAAVHLCQVGADWCQGRYPASLG